MLTIPVFLKEVIHVKCSIKYLLPRFLNKKAKLRCLWDSLKLKCFTMRLISYLFQSTNNFQSHLMFINLHSHAILHPNEHNYSTCTFFPSMYIFCQCVAYDLGTCQAVGISKVITFPLFWPPEVLTLGWNYNLGISFCSIMLIIVERHPKKEGEEKKKLFFLNLEQCTPDLLSLCFTISLFTLDIIHE